jgi:predicted amidohydrolase
MSKTIQVATLQMDANPAPVEERLRRAEGIITRAAQDGAQLVVLPELFNTGYGYTNVNFDLAEPMDGKTSSWMKAIASHLSIHLAGSLLIHENGEIYNSLLLFSPSGECWRYDKSYPWAWERGYFRERHGVTVAHTNLGDLGMLLCWDVAHLNLWREYAGQVDMIVAASCPPDAPNATFQFPDGSQLDFSDLGSAMDSIKTAGEQTFGEIVDQQARWLGVPVVNSGVTGLIRTYIPKAKSLVLSFLLLLPRLVKQLKDAEQMEMSSGMIASCKIVNANGQVIAQRNPSEGEGYAMAKVNLQEQKPKPSGAQPKSTIPSLAYLNADVMVPLMMRSVYQKGKRRINAKRG